MTPRTTALLDRAQIDRETTSALTISRRALVKRAAALSATVPSVAGLVAAARTPTVAAQAGEGGVVNLVQGSDRGMGNPIIAVDGGFPGWIGYLTFNRLLHYSDRAEPLPELAASWEFGADGTEVTFHLHDAKWHDGQPFGADDVIFTFDMIKDERTNTPLRSRLQVAGQYVTWEKIDDRTVRITMPEPFGLILNNLEIVPIIPKHLLEQTPDINTDPFNDRPIGTGPFRLVEWQRDQFIRYERFDDYFMGRPKADGYVVRFFTGDWIAALEAGEIDTAFATPPQFERARNSPDLTLATSLQPSPVTLAFHQKHPILADVRVRKAMSMAIDKQPLVDLASAGAGLVAHNQYTQGGTFDRFNDYDNVKPTPYNLDEANQLLDDAGYPRGGDGIRATPDGRKLSFSCITPSGFEVRERTQLLLQEALAPIGVELRLQLFPEYDLLLLLADPTTDPETAALLIWGWPSPLRTDPDVFLELHSANVPPGNNWMYFQDDEIDRLIVEGRRVADVNERIGIYRQLDVRRAELVPSIPLFSTVWGILVSSRLRGVDLDSPNLEVNRWYSFWQWWKEE